MTKFAKLLALILALVVLFTSCDVFGGQSGTNTETSTTASTTTESTESETQEKSDPVDEQALYRESISRSRKELEAMLTLTEQDFTDTQAKLEAFEALAVVSDDYDAVDALYMDFEDAFYHLDTQVSIASIIYYLNMKDEAASERYLDSYDKFGDLYNAYIESCKKAYEQSPIRDELFADWTEEEIKELFAYDPESQELREANEEILVELNEQTGPGADDRIAELYAQIVTNNNKIAELAGYDNYYTYASVEIYGRDYTAEDVATFRGYVLEYFVPKMDSLYNSWYNRYSKLSQYNSELMLDFLYEPFDSMKENYLEGYINSYEGSTKDGFNHMFENRNMVFTSSLNSHQSAFQTYLEELETPFCLFGKNGQSTSSIAHEMGHYYAALYNPHVNSMDLAETQSQTNELLLLDYTKDALPRPVYNTLKGYSVYNFVIQSIVCVIIDEFEQKVYALDSVEGYGSAEFDAIMKEVCEQYGGITYVNSNITDMNDYWRAVATNSPVYYISYATSMVESLNIFAIACQDSAQGREMYRKLVEEVNEDDGFSGAISKIGLTSPFQKETFDAISGLMTK